MPRDIPVGNGDLLVTFDDLYQVRDIYYPRVGMPNHTGGHVQHFGIWADGRFAWIDEDGWTRDLRYLPDTMVTEVVLTHEKLGLQLICNDAVDYWSPVYFRKVTVIDLGILATALGLPEHEDRYKEFKLHSEISAALEDCREFIEANGLDMSSLREMLPPMLEGKDKGLSLW